MNKNWIKNIHYMLNDFSDIDSQKDVWLGFNPNKISSWDEDISLLFDSFNFDDFIIECRKEKIDCTLLMELTEFRNMLDIYSENIYVLMWDDYKIVNDPEWLKIVDKAKRVVDMWNL